MTALFGEDPKKTTPDEFFGVFDQFLSSLNHSAGQNRRRQKIKEEEAKRIKIENQVNNFMYVLSSVLVFNCTRKQFYLFELGCCPVNAYISTCISRPHGMLSG